MQQLSDINHEIHACEYEISAIESEIIEEIESMCGNAEHPRSNNAQIREEIKKLENKLKEAELQLNLKQQHREQLLHTFHNLIPGPGGAMSRNDRKFANMSAAWKKLQYLERELEVLDNYIFDLEEHIEFLENQIQDTQDELSGEAPTLGAAPQASIQLLRAKLEHDRDDLQADENDLEVQLEKKQLLEAQIDAIKHLYPILDN